ncbi:hypothetical protein [Haladaptatus sp. DFWS20]|uniref:hypothetical protein n=1 Tax=Haladaptatus sp. DFWS20 TaxID=3403467 RepID=UPI003EBD59A7
MAFESLRERSKLGLARMAGFYLSVLVFVFFWFLAFNFQLVAVFTGWFDPALTDTIHFVHNIAGATWLWVWGLAMLAIASVFQPTMSGLDITWAALAILWALALVGAYEWSVRRNTLRSTAAPPKQPNVSP